MTGSAKIVLVEDEAFQRQVIAECLAQYGLRPLALASGTEIKRLAQHAMPDLALLDVHLNEPEDGFALARWLRSRSATRLESSCSPLSAIRSIAWSDLESGADDYVTKPFEPRELVARVKALLRRAGVAVQPAQMLTEVRVGSAILDLRRHILVLADGTTSGLSASEFDLLRLFVENPNRPLSRDWLLETIAHRDAEVIRPSDRQPRHAPASQGRARSEQARGDPQRARRRIYVRAFSRLNALPAASRPAAAPCHRPRSVPSQDRRLSPLLRHAPPVPPAVWHQPCARRHSGGAPKPPDVAHPVRHASPLCRRAALVGEILHQFGEPDSIVAEQAT